MDIGIDLGTTFSVIVVPGRVDLSPSYGEGEYWDECEVTIIPTPDGEKTFPSVLFQETDDEGRPHLVVGMEAKQAAERGESPIMWSKRKIGTNETLLLADTSFTAKEVAREILRFLKACAEEALGQPVTRAVITHPAYFDRSQVEETREAAKEAGFDMSLPEQLIMEPVAAALAYTRSDPTDPLDIMVYDLGGGTFDVTILERRHGIITPLAFDGDHLLGGINFDRKLAKWIIDRASLGGERPIIFDETNPEDRGRWARLMQYAEQLKERLANMGQQQKVKVDVRLDFLVDREGKKVQVRDRISQYELLEMIKPDLQKTIMACQRCLTKADKKPGDLDYILLVGGSTYGPWVVDMVKQAFGKDPLQFRGDLAVGSGAALFSKSLPAPPHQQGELRLTLEVQEVSPLSEIFIPGHLESPGAGALAELMVLLRTPQGETLGPMDLTPDGGFLFENVRLLENRPTPLRLQVIDAQGMIRLDHKFSVTWEEKTQITTVTPVLPKPLSVKTARGMRLLAEEGEPLPSKVLEEEFVRLSDEPELTLDIYQGEEAAGKINITDIPPEAGEGAKVLLMVRVTEKNELRGEAVFKTPRTGEEVYRAPVRVNFPPLPIPDLTALRQKYRELEDLRSERIYLANDPELRTTLAGQGEILAQEIQELFDSPNPDRQEVLRGIRELDRLINPPQDDIQPPKALFDSLLSECRLLIAQQKGDPAVQNRISAVDQCEHDGLEAFKKKDRKKWGAINASLQSLYEKLKPKEPRPPIPPTPLLKDQGKMAIEETRAELDKARDIARTSCPEKYERKYKGQLLAMEAALNRMEDQIDKIPDTLPDMQGLAQVQIAIRDLKKIEKKAKHVAACVEVE